MLAGRGIVVTRPRNQAAGLTKAIENAGGYPIAFPTIEIGPPRDLARVLGQLEGLERFDLALFASANAVRMAFQLLAKHLPGGRWPANLEVACIGPGTAAALAGEGVNRVTLPSDSMDSEGLLEMPNLADMRGKRVAIFRGQGGRSLLGDTLTERGARVSYIEAYARLLARSDPEPLLNRWRRTEVAAVTVSSGEGLDNLLRLIGDDGSEYLRKSPLFVPHVRVSSQARRLGLDLILLAGPTDTDMLSALVAYFGMPK